MLQTVAFPIVLVGTIQDYDGTATLGSSLLEIQ